MKPLWAIAWLTWKAAFRFRLFWALGILLLVSVITLPLLVKDDGTARGFIQILLSYNLSVMATLLGFATLWLSCGTLARDIEDCQMQLVVVKPVARWTIWLGKWLGILALNAVLLGVSGACVFWLVQWRAQRLPPAQQEVLRNEIFVARASLREKTPDFKADAERIFKERLAQTPVPAEDQPYVRRQIEEQLKAGMQIIPPGYKRRFELDLGLQQFLVRDQPLFLRFRFYAARTNATGAYLGLWQVGPPETAQVSSYPMSLAADTFHEIQTPPNVLDASGKLTVEFVNRDQTALLFPLEDGFEVLYREGSFGMNYARGLMVLLSWMGLLAALGLAAGSFLSFPVAAFFALSLLMTALSSGLVSTFVEEGTVTGVNHETGEGGLAWVDTVLLPFFKGVIRVTGLVREFSPVDALSTGRSISWGQLLQAWSKVVLLLGGVLAALGMIAFTRRELALPQGHG